MLVRKVSSVTLGLLALLGGAEKAWCCTGCYHHIFYVVR